MIQSRGKVLWDKDPRMKFRISEESKPEPRFCTCAKNCLGVYQYMFNHISSC